MPNGKNGSYTQISIMRMRQNMKGGLDVMRFKGKKRIFANILTTDHPNDSSRGGICRSSTWYR